MKTLNWVFFFALLLVSGKLFTGCNASDPCCPDEDGFLTSRVDTVFIEKEIIKEGIGPDIKVIPGLGSNFDLTVQIGAFKNRQYADSFLEIARQRLGTEVYSTYEPDELYRISIGSYKDLEAARKFLQSIKNKGYPDAFLRDKISGVRVDL